MRKIWSVLLAAVLALSAAGCSETTTDITQQTDKAVVLGDEQFEIYIPLLEGKKVALFSNHTGIVGDKTSDAATVSAADDTGNIHFGVDSTGKEITCGEHILSALTTHGVNVTVAFAPEHGFGGTQDTGATVDNAVDAKTGVPILSLAGDAELAPSPEDMQKFDALVVDIQDVGLRFFTYYLSMYRLMDACAQQGKEVIILDRPNPNGFYIDGPILKDKFKSDVGQLPIPIVHGMTLGELAQMINGEGWLSAGKNACRLTVIPCQNYTHQTKIALIQNPSPNIKDMRAVYLYASTCFFEQTAISVGRGTDSPFEVYGSPYLKEVDGYDYSFTPVSVSGATKPPFMNEKCFGADLRDIPLSEIQENQIHLEYLVSAYQAIRKAAPDQPFWGKPDKEGRYWIDKLTGTDMVRRQIEYGMTAAEIKAGWQTEIRAFAEQRRPYLLYAE